MRTFGIVCKWSNIPYFSSEYCDSAINVDVDECGRRCDVSEKVEILSNQFYN